jgi:hypothetical protein
VIDHGNGITTTYGHLDELSVDEDDVVAQGQAIGIGGSTGVSTGIHLHFEVRKDGATVDPLTVLPTEEVASSPQSIDCASGLQGVPVGSQVLYNFAGMLQAGERVVAVQAQPLNEGPALEHRVDGISRVRVTSPLDFDGPTREDRYDLQVTIDRPNGNRVVNCPLSVQRESVATVFYVRAIPPEEPEPEPTAEPTPTPTQVIPIQVPSYEVPTSSGAGSQPPAYGVPAGATPIVSSPSYGIPGAQ